MAEQRVHFTGHDGHQLVGSLATPPGHAFGWILFAHCFTCGKDLRSARILSRTLCDAGWGVLRFDFTGIGESEGDFADKTFSGNVQDLVAAAAFMAEQGIAPTVLVGHSWGGAAVISASPQIASVRGVVTIGAPSDPEHVTDLFEDSLDEIRERGSAQVNLAGRLFTIGRDLVENLADQRLERILQEGGRSLMVMHSPQDQLVGIEHATRLYKFARHPKSFVSLDRADHLLTDPQDASWVGQMIAGWACRLVAWHARGEELVEEESGTRRGVVDVAIGRTGLHVGITAGQHHLVADEPVKVGGQDWGPTPYELLLGSLGACTAMTLRMYASRKQWPLESVDVQLHHDRSHAGDAAGGRGEFHVHRAIALHGPLDEEQRSRLMQIADRCPVHRTLQGEVVIVSEEVEPEQ